MKKKGVVSVRTAIRNLWTVGLILLLGFFCTIRDDNGDPAISGPTGPKLNPSTDQITPSIFASPENAIRLDDTLRHQGSRSGDTSISIHFWPGLIDRNSSANKEPA